MDLGDYVMTSLRCLPEHIRRQFGLKKWQSSSIHLDQSEMWVNIVNTVMYRTLVKAAQQMEYSNGKEGIKEWTR